VWRVVAAAAAAAAAAAWSKQLKLGSVNIRLDYNHGKIKQEEEEDAAQPPKSSLRRCSISRRSGGWSHHQIFAHDGLFAGKPLSRPKKAAAAAAAALPAARELANDSFPLLNLAVVKDEPIDLLSIECVQSSICSRLFAAALPQSKVGPVDLSLQYGWTGHGKLQQYWAGHGEPQQIHFTGSTAYVTIDAMHHSMIPMR